MVKLYNTGVYLMNGKEIIPEDSTPSGFPSQKEESRKQTISYSILKNHNHSGDEKNLKLKFDSMASHDITYVGIIQTARASGMTKFPIPYVLTNCHNSLCAVGGTINEDDHFFGLSAAKKYGGIFVPTHMAVIHQYMREMMSGCGKMILGSDSHTRYGALGTMAVGEGGGELAKQLLGKTYDVPAPDIVGVYLDGSPTPGVGPMDVALAIVSAVFENGFVKNKVMEFTGPGIGSLNVEYRNGIDVMTTETTCLSSIWQTDEAVRKYYEIHGRAEDYTELKPGNAAYYDSFIYVDLSSVKPMIALPFHPSHVYEIDYLNRNLSDIAGDIEKRSNEQLGLSNISFSLRDKIRGGKLHVQQGSIVGCAGGTFDNISDAADILNGVSVGDGEFSLSIYPSSQPTFLSLMQNGTIARLMESGCVIRSAFCGPCFGAGDVPANNSLSVRHATRNFPSREGSKPGNGQLASVALMDARSVAATARNKGMLTPATDFDASYTKPIYSFSTTVYNNRVYFGHDNAMPQEELKFGPNIADWPEMPSLTDNLLLRAASVIHDPVTTTDELIPSGETSSYRSNPLGLAEFTLSRKDPEYVGRAKQVHTVEKRRCAGDDPSADPHFKKAFDTIATKYKLRPADTGIGSFVYAVKPGDGSAREQAASCQRVLGGWANIAGEYATKRYRSNLMNWGMIPFLLEGEPPFEVDDFIFIPGIKKAITDGEGSVTAYIVRETLIPLVLSIGAMTEDERGIILAGSLINSYKHTL